ncbi:Bro-N domain-containing protein [Ruegeria sp. HKCCA6948]|uniref:BRO-N domain-containing protein n=1 Tax=unclassified Ruegeria TaxID=2625375 RepID=UPI0035303326
MEIDGNPWFVAKDVTEVLTIGSVTNATTNLDETEVRNFKLTQGRARPNKLISESGLYKIIMRSNKPEARAFQNWVTQVVLPSIRKDRGYIAGEEKAGVRETQ